MEKRTQVRLVIVAILAALALTIVLQNTANVTTRFLWITVSMPHIVLLLTTLAVGFLGGIVASGIRSSRRRR